MKSLSLLLIFFTVCMTTSPLYSAPELDIPALEQAAQQGDIKAQFQLGTAYYTGEGVEQNYQRAVKWFLSVANAGFAPAQHNLGVAYSNGQGVPQNFKEAVKWYQKAAEQKDARAQNNLGYLYQTGQGVPKNVVEAANWYQKAADQGYAVAQYNLGIAYSHGQGVPQDQKQAIRWLGEAAAQGHLEAQIEWAILKKASSSEFHSLTPKVLDTSKTDMNASMAPIELIADSQPPFTAEKTAPKTESVIEKTMEESPSPVSTVTTDKTTLSQYVIALNYSRPQDQPFINQLAAFLTTKGYTVDHIERVATEVEKSQWDIRYYHDNLQPALELKTHLQTFLPTVSKTNLELPETTIQVRDFSFLRGQQTTHPGRLEIWLLNAKPIPITSTQNSPRQQALSQSVLSLQYANQKDQAFMQQLATFLRKQGYQVDRVGQVQVPPFGKTQWDIRYYYDQQAAETLKTYIEKFATNQGIEPESLRVRDFSFLLKKGQKIRQGRMEVWILNP
jgi:hypothetical protein